MSLAVYLSYRGALVQTSLSILCRYVDKDALHEIHEHSMPYLQLKDDIKAEGIEYTSVISQSYYEQDLGFMETKF